MFCADIAKLELLIKGLSATKQHLSKCDFRRHLLEFCKESFEKIFNMPDKFTKEENENEDDRLDRELRYKHKLFGNIDFVGELFS